MCLSIIIHIIIVKKFFETRNVLSTAKTKLKLFFFFLKTGSGHKTQLWFLWPRSIRVLSFSLACALRLFSSTNQTDSSQTTSSNEKHKTTEATLNGCLFVSFAFSFWVQQSRETIETFREKRNYDTFTRASRIDCRKAKRKPHRAPIKMREEV